VCVGVRRGKMGGVRNMEKRKRGGVKERLRRRDSKKKKVASKKKSLRLYLQDTRCFDHKAHRKWVSPQQEEKKNS